LIANNPYYVEVWYSRKLSLPVYRRKVKQNGEKSAPNYFEMSISVYFNERHISRRYPPLNDRNVPQATRLIEGLHAVVFSHDQSSVTTQPVAWVDGGAGRVGDRRLSALAFRRLLIH
jgi:hypothetical protein